MSDTSARPSAAFLRASAPLAGDFRVPGDKSISHRALILATMATGTSRITGLLEGDDVLATADAMRALGAQISRRDDGVWEVTGCGPAGLKTPARPLDFANSGTGARLVMGVVAGAGISAKFTGDASLSRRPMARVTLPLALTGAQIEDGGTGKLPLTITGAATPLPIDVTPEIASAQVKSAILLAGLGAAGHTIVREKHITRDHTENMLALFGAKISSQRSGAENAENIVTLEGHARLRAHDIAVPGDPSSAAFPLVAALIVPGSTLRLKNVLLNPQRDGLIRALTRMGGNIKRVNERMEAGEPIADLQVSHSALKGIEVESDVAPSMIDEYPALAVAAAFAEGTTHMAGIGELRVKESDRLA
ncbi:MAG TPA: 3-phosphoshikimate 1-carboxyvinyltransferase, partial [Rhodobiaceae bacterium]|nr:3-phosphoshikimate 1-carboxyvinyltransferase [Rhodobiaceae bacterium]